MTEAKYQALLSNFCSWQSLPGDGHTTYSLVPMTLLCMRRVLRWACLSCLSLQKQAMEEQWMERECSLRYKYKRRTRTITPVLEEVYIRHDIPCGIQACPHCAAPSTSGASIPTQPSLLVLPDGHVLREYLELWELPEAANVVITRSAVQQFSSKAGLRQSSRLRSLYRDRRRAVYLFDDKHCAWTARSRSAPPLAAAEFYAQHVEPPTQIVVVSDQLARVTEPQDLILLLERLHVREDPLDNGSATATVASGSSYPASVLSSNSSTAVSSLPDPRTTHTTGRGHQHRPRVRIMPAAEFFLWYFSQQPTALDLAESLLQSKLSKAQALLNTVKADSLISTSAAGEQQQDDTGSSTAGIGMDIKRWYKAACAAHEWHNRPYLPQHIIEDGLTQGTLMLGTLVMSKRSADEGVVQVGRGSDMQLGMLLRISGRAALGRAMHGDKVAVLVVEEPIDTSGTGAARATATAINGTSDASTEAETDMQLLSAEPEGTQEPDAAEQLLAGNGPTVLASIPAAVVVGLLGREGGTLVATLSTGDEQALRSKEAVGSQQRTESVLVVPYDRRYPQVRVRTRAPQRLLRQRLVVQVDDWLLGNRYPDGHVMRMLGEVNDVLAEGQAVLEQAGIRWQPFCDAALAELPQVPSGQADAWRPAPQERQTRRDLTGSDYFICSIDPVGCTDVDDALHVRFLASGKVEVGVHIADVSYFVRQHSMLDMEARDRCTSVYLVDRRLDMLPSLLSEQLCSLLENRERYAVSVIWTLQDPGPAEPLQVLDMWYGRTIIRSRHQLHYQQAQDVLDGVPPAPGDALPSEHIKQLLPALQLLKRLTDQLHDGRMADGALELESAELRFKTDAAGQPTEVLAKPKIPMMGVIAEMMIWANAAVAKRVCAAFPSCALLRCHPPPRQQAFEQIKGLLGKAEGNQKLDPASNKAFASALAAACQRASRRDAAAVQLLKGMATRAMSEAKYFSTGSAPPGSAAAYHYGLALPYYTHFTSPIRRYADIVVHRQLLAALALEQMQKHAQAETTHISSTTVPPPALTVTPSPPPPSSHAAATGAAGAVDGVMTHAELVMAAMRMNDQHRAAKDAQQRCSELYLLLLLHRVPHVEQALVASIQDDGWIEVFVPAYQLKARVRMRDSQGIVVPPVTSDMAKDSSSADAFELAERRHLAYRCSPDSTFADIIDTRDGRVIWKADVWGRMLVVLSADSNTLHGPRLKCQAVSDLHPDVAAQRGAVRQQGAASLQPVNDNFPRLQQGAGPTRPTLKAAALSSLDTVPQLHSSQLSGTVRMPQQLATTAILQAQTPDDMAVNSAVSEAASTQGLGASSGASAVPEGQLERVAGDGDSSSLPHRLVTEQVLPPTGEIMVVGTERKTRAERAMHSKLARYLAKASASRLSARGKECSVRGMHAVRELQKAMVHQAGRVQY